MLNLTKTHNFYPFFTQTNSESNNNGNWHTQLVHTKFNTGSPRLDNYHQSFSTADRSLGSMCPGLAEPSNPLARISADQCLKFCDDMHLLQRPLQ